MLSPKIFQISVRKRRSTISVKLEKEMCTSPYCVSIMEWVILFRLDIYKVNKIQEAFGYKIKICERGNKFMILNIWNVKCHIKEFLLSY